MSDNLIKTFATEIIKLRLVLWCNKLLVAMHYLTKNTYSNNQLPTGAMI